MIFTIFVIVVGLLVSLLLFFRFPYAGSAQGKDVQDGVSVVIPARNEEKNLPLLLSDLQSQTRQPLEIICVDDGSADKTADIISRFGCRLISVKEKPEGWNGKSWACQVGADAARGKHLLFLDADVRLSPEGLDKLIRTYGEDHCTISVQPYHKTVKAYEQLSLFFNMVQVGVNGLGMPRSKKIGLYGPVILISRADYMTAGGHAGVKSSVIEDVDLGIALKKSGLAFNLYLGDKDIYFRMYAGGLRDLWRGWLKNFAAGAAHTPPMHFLMVFFWITSCTSVPIQLVKAAFAMDAAWLLIYALIYMLWVFELRRISCQVGHFRIYSIVFYPVCLAMFLLVFSSSLLKRLLHIKTDWKGRKV